MRVMQWLLFVKQISVSKCHQRVMCVLILSQIADIFAVFQLDQYDGKTVGPPRQLLLRTRNRLTQRAAKGKPVERRGRKATGLRTQVYDSGVAGFSRCARSSYLTEIQ